MKPDCLSERDLILLHYGESPDGTTLSAATAHLAGCSACRDRQQRLAADLARIPALADPDPAVATRMAARVSEQLARRPARRWLPVLGGAAVAAVALILTLVAQAPRPGIEQAAQPSAAPTVTMALDEEMPDLEFLEDLELIENLELLRQIEGV